MTETQIEQVKRSAHDIFVQLGFSPVTINEKTVYEHKSQYFMLTSVWGLKSFVIESAASLQDAQKNLYEDSDLFSYALGIERLLAELKEVLVEYYLD